MKSFGGASRRGFSLVELMVVVTVLLALTVMILPELGGALEGELLRAAGRELVAVMQLAQSQAVTSQRAHLLRIDTRDGRFWIEAPLGEGESGFAPAHGLAGSAGEIDRRIRLQVRSAGEKAPAEDSSGTIHFRPDGTADAGEVLLEDREGFRLALRVHPTTARVRAVNLGRKAIER